MESLLNVQITVPLPQIGALIFLSTIAVFLGKYRVALMAIYIFMFFWVYLLSGPPAFARSLYQVDAGPAVLYYGLGFVVIVLTTIGLLRAAE